MKKLVLAAVLLSILCAWPTAVSAKDASWLKLSLWGDIAVGVSNGTDTVHGLDFGIGSTTNHVCGVQLDLIYSHVNHDLNGVQASWIYASAPSFNGVQSSLIDVADHFNGVQWGLANINKQHFTGVQLGLANYNKGDFTGIQLGLGNYSNSFTGGQVGWLNIAKDVKGLQFGFVNYTETIYGLQIGLVNIATKNWLPAMIFINGRF